MSEMMRVEIPGCPDSGLSPNSRIHWRVKARLVAQAKGDARWCAHDAAPRAENWPAFDGPVSVRAVIFWAKRRKAVDGDNALAMLKPTFDGMNGIIWADDGYCTFLPVEQARDPDGIGAIVIEVTA